MKRPKRSAPPTWLQPGIVVDYSSVIGEEPTEFSRIVRTVPAQLGGSWVVWIEGKSGCVHVDALRPAATPEDDVTS